MTPEEKGSAESVLRRILPYTTVLLLIVAGYVAWTFYSRYSSSNQAEEKARTERRERDRQLTASVFGNGEVRILNLSVDQHSLRRGETANLCYGVANATVVTLDPQLEATKPSTYHCLEIAPRRTTTYKLVAKNAKGQSADASVTVTVE